MIIFNNNKKTTQTQKQQQQKNKKKTKKMEGQEVIDAASATADEEGGVGVGSASASASPSKMGMLESFIRSPQGSLKTLFQRKGKGMGSSSLSDSSSPNNNNNNNNYLSSSSSSSSSSPRPIPQLSLLANSVVARCSKILGVPTEELQHNFDIELPESVKQLFTYARNFVEFCSYQALQQVITRTPDYLSDNDFRRLTFDMMLAWEAPSIQPDSQLKEAASCGNKEPESDDEDGWSLFYSSSMNMAVQVDDTKTVGREAFARIAPACAAVADIVTVHNLFDALASSSANRLHFLIYDKYLRSLDKVIKAAKNTPGPLISNLQLAEGEIILDVDGAVPTQPVLQHIGISAWPGRLTLTNYAIYFESLGVGIYDKAVRYDLASDIKQVIKPEFTGPLGARVFDKAVMYKSTAIAEPVYFEFPEFKGNSRRDYWLDICLEILHSHSFIRKHNFKEIQQSEVLARATLGILRYRAVREAFKFFSSHYKTLLCFKLAESLPRGDAILETLSNRLALLKVAVAQRDGNASPCAKRQSACSPIALVTLARLGFILEKDGKVDGEATIFGDLWAGENHPLEVAVKKSILDTGRAEAAQATVDRVKVEGIDTNVAVMKELLFPVIELARRLQRLASWKDPVKSTMFLILSCYAIARGWTRYLLPFMLVCCAVFMFLRRQFNKKKPLEAFKVKAPPNKNAVEQLLTLQEAITQVEALMQTGNIVLLKMRALLFAVLPQATERIALLLVIVAAVVALLPLRHLVLLIFLEAFTREMPCRKASSDRWLRRLKEWWIRIPAAPVQLIKLEDKKKKK